MKNLIFCFLLLTFFAACKNDDDAQAQDIPACVKALYEPGASQDTTLQTVKRQEVGDEFHYWLNTGAMAFDGLEYIVNETCDTVCFFSMLPQTCIADYANDDWEIVWEK